MINLYHALNDRKFDARMILQVHDELVLEVPDEELEPVRDLVIEVMSTAFKLAVTLKVDAQGGAELAGYGLIGLLRYDLVKKLCYTWRSAPNPAPI